MIELNRRSFIKGAVASTIVLLAPLSSLSAVEQVRELDKHSIKDVLAGNVKVIKSVDISKFEKAFLVGFHRRGHIIRPVHIDTVKSGGMYSVTLTVGEYGDRCHPRFRASEHMATDFNFMKSVTNDVYKVTEAFFSMTDQERAFANRGIM